MLSEATFVWFWTHSSIVYMLLHLSFVCHLTFHVSKKKRKKKQRTDYIINRLPSHTKLTKMAKQPILKELEYFVNGATTATSINPSALSHLVHCGLNLLHNLPSSRDAVFEYFTIFFDASVAGYVKLIEVSIKSMQIFAQIVKLSNVSVETIEIHSWHFIWFAQQKDPNLVASYDSTVGEVQDVLETLINHGQHAWVPYISTWSIKTLGLLSKKYKRSDNRGEQNQYDLI